MFRDLQDEDMIQMVYEKCILGWAMLADLVHQKTAILLSILKHRLILSQHYDSQQDIYLIQVYVDFPRKMYNGRWYSRTGTSHAWGKTLCILWPTLPIFQFTRIYTLVAVTIKGQLILCEANTFLQQTLHIKKAKRTKTQNWGMEMLL